MFYAPKEVPLGDKRKRLHSTLGYRSLGQMFSEWFLEQEQEKQVA